MSLIFIIKNKAYRGIPLLRELFPDKNFPLRPDKDLSHRDAVSLIGICEQVINPYNLGIKTCNWTFIEYATIYKELGYPVVAIVRDIRDALISPLPEDRSEGDLNVRYRLIWKNMKLYDVYLHYEDLVMNPEEVMTKISKVLSHDFNVRREWNTASIHRTMIKNRRHDLLKIGTISGSRVGIWKTSRRTFSEETHETARIMGY